jgi:hypothetical protein
MLSLSLAYLYYLKIVIPHGENAAHSIISVSTFNTYKPYQFRLLVPFIFILFKPISFIPQKTIFLFYTALVIYLIILIYFKVLSEYFQNTKANFILACSIIYPMIWNYVILNQSYQYYDFTAILIFTFGLYLIIKEKFFPLTIVLVIGVFNKETSGYLVFAYLLYNYKSLFTWKILFRTSLLVIVYIAIKVILSYVFRNNPGDTIEICLSSNIEIIKSIFSNTIYLKNILLNFGGIYISIFLLFLSSRWKKFPSKKLLFINLAFLPNIFLGFFVTYFDEVRVYAEFIPLVTTLFLVYLSTFKKLNLKPVIS